MASFDSHSIEKVSNGNYYIFKTTQLVGEVSKECVYVGLCVKVFLEQDEYDPYLLFLNVYMNQLSDKNISTIPGWSYLKMISIPKTEITEIRTATPYNFRIMGVDVRKSQSMIGTPPKNAKEIVNAVTTYQSLIPSHEKLDTPLVQTFNTDWITDLTNNKGSTVKQNITGTIKTTSISDKFRYIIFTQKSPTVVPLSKNTYTCWVGITDTTITKETRNPNTRLTFQSLYKVKTTSPVGTHLVPTGLRVYKQKLVEININNIDQVILSPEIIFQSRCNYLQLVEQLNAGFVNALTALEKSPQSTTINKVYALIASSVAGETEKPVVRYLTNTAIMREICGFMMSELLLDTCVGDGPSGGKKRKTTKHAHRKKRQPVTTKRTNNRRKQKRTSRRKAK